MRIGLLPPGTEVITWLAGQPGVSEREFPSAGDLRVNGVWLQETSDFWGASETRTTDRGNLTTTVEFSTARIFPLAADAELWSLDYDEASPREGTLILESLSPGGVTTRRYLPSAVLQSPVREVIGVSVRLRYSATGGAITATEP